MCIATVDEKQILILFIILSFQYLACAQNDSCNDRSVGFYGRSGIDK